MRGTAVTISHQYKRLGLIGSILVLVGIVALGGGVGYWLLTGMNYTWRWYRVPNYFYAFVEEKVFAERDGVVISVEKRGWRTQEIVIQEADSRQSYLITDAYLPLAEGYPITQGDLLGVRTTGQIGLLSRGLLLTLSVSAISLVGAVLIGGCGGVTLYAGLPPARWLLTGVTEILNDIPLLWHVLLWQFVVSPMLYLGLESLGVDISLSPWFAAIALMYWRAYGTHRGSRIGCRRISEYVPRKRKHIYCGALAAYSYAMESPHQGVVVVKPFRRQRTHKGDTRGDHDHTPTI